MKLKMIPLGDRFPDTGDAVYVYLQRRDGFMFAKSVEVFEREFQDRRTGGQLAIVAWWPIPIPKPCILPADLTKDLKKPCWFWDDYEKDRIIGELTAVKASGAYKYKSRTRWFKNYRRVKPEDIEA